MFATVFDLNGTQLRISEVSGHQPPPHTVLLGWEVADIEASVKALKAKGVVFNVYEGFGQDALGILDRARQHESRGVVPRPRRQ